MSYQTLVFLPKNSKASLEAAYKTLSQSEAFSGHGTKVVKTSNRIKVSSGGWTLTIAFATGDAVRDESAEIVERYGDSRGDREILASCEKRFELFGDEDPEMEHFGDYILVIEHLNETYKGVAFELHSEEFV